MTTGTVTTNNLTRAANLENTETQRRFGIMVMLDASVETMLEQARQAEALGFDQVFFPDHMGDFRNMAGPWFDGWSMIAAAAIATKAIRIGALVSNPILRAPALLAKQAITVDHLSGGRLDLGIGAGLFAHDHHAVGSEPWAAKERAERFAEYVEIVDGVLRGAGQPYSFEGRWLWARDVPTAPGPVQQPRPPLIVGGQSPTVRRVAAAWADVWDTHGPIGASFEEILETTARQNRELDEFCSAAGRSPASLRRSLTTLLATDPWSAPVSFEEVVERFTPAGTTEFVIGWPPEDRIGELERLAQVVMPGLRES